ncbi:uncharacterized protein [Elaeis guineensis]|uniref:uncharacterized protein n=1 Tax=Elaeis guineensis var. tenera TaxID=51953 RepID=UPI003C6CFD53
MVDEQSQISQVQATLQPKIREGLLKDPAAVILKQLIEEGKMRRFWIEDGLIFTKGCRMYVPQECTEHLPSWSGHTTGQKWGGCGRICSDVSHLPVGQGNSPSAYHLAKEWHRNTEIARAYLEKAAKKMKKWADRGRRPLDFKQGDMVLVKLQPAQLRFFHKVHKGLVRKYEGPFPIIRRIENVSYQLQLPVWFKVHPVFHGSCLKPYHANQVDPTRNMSSRPTPTSTSLERWVDIILMDRVHVLPSGAEEIQYLVKWRGLLESEASWKLEDSLRHEEDRVEAYRRSTSMRTSI